MREINRLSSSHRVDVVFMTPIDHRTWSTDDIQGAMSCVIGVDNWEAGRMLALPRNVMELQISTYTMGNGARPGLLICNLLALSASEGVRLSGLQGRQTI
ncbi:hypothetical protein H4S14_002471 [Agrobacterium vitis]|nr:hypothetical protein [Agrobacterium vitis]MBE1438715.1 hypothetical protein [Agrobacterium vitis]